MKDFRAFIRDFRAASPSLKRFILGTLYKALLFNATSRTAWRADNYQRWHARLDHNISARVDEMQRRYREEQEK